MGFGREARRAGDAALPVGRRMRALGSCIEIARPLGYRTTFAYLEARVGLPSSDPRFVDPALALLLQERALRLRDEAAYAELRTARKREGRRTPSRREVRPGWPKRWHGDERVGARVALAHLLQERRPWATADVAAAAARDDTSPELLRRLWERSLRRWMVTDLEVLEQVHLVRGGEVRLGEPIDFLRATVHAMPDAARTQEGPGSLPAPPAS